MTDLFGNTVSEEVRKAKPAITRILGPLHYRPSEGKERRCATCAHHMLHLYARTYHKCDLVGSSNGPGTDIRAKWVCDAWTPEDNR